MLAYVDPGTGSFMLQALVAALAAAAVAVNAYWKKLKAFFGGRREQPSAPEPPDPADE